MNIADVVELLVSEVHGCAMVLGTDRPETHCSDLGAFLGASTIWSL